MSESGPERRSELHDALIGTPGHGVFDEAVSTLTWEVAGTRVPGCPYTAFSLVWHVDAVMRAVIALVEEDGLQADQGDPPDFADRWPAHLCPLARAEWEICVSGTRRSLERISGWIDSCDLTAPIAGDPAHCTAWYVIRIAGHNAYHLGQLETYRHVVAAGLASGGIR